MTKYRNLSSGVGKTQKLILKTCEARVILSQVLKSYFIYLDFKAI